MISITELGTMLLTSLNPSMGGITVKVTFATFHVSAANYSTKAARDGSGKDVSRCRDTRKKLKCFPAATATNGGHADDARAGALSAFASGLLEVYFVNPPTDNILATMVI